MANTELRKKHDVFLWLASEKELHLFSKHNIEGNTLKVVDHLGEEYAIDHIGHDEKKRTIHLKKKINLSNNYFVLLQGHLVPAYISSELLKSNFYYSNNDLGARFKGQDIIFKFWSPPSTSVKINVYKADTKLKLFDKKLTRREKGVWYSKITPQMVGVPSLDGLYYDLEVTAYNQTKTVLDPYALSMAPFNPKNGNKIGRGAFINIEKLEKLRKKRAYYRGEADFIGYEAHIRDFTIDPNLDIKKDHIGTYLGFKKIIKNIADLGITHIQLMPLQNFYTVDEEVKEFQGAGEHPENINYNWGYDPHNFFSPEGWYSTDPKDPYKRLNELISLTNSIHENKLSVILDVVYNHVYEETTIDAGAPGCYLRRNEYGDVSFHTGAGPSLESRNPMVRKLIVESLLHYQNIFGFDGFRFDLMNFIDHDTMIEIRNKLGNKSVLYGEAWSFTDLPEGQATTKTNLPEGINLSVFNDSSRDAYSGRMSSSGYVQGVFHEAPNVRAGIIGGLKGYESALFEISSDPYKRFARKPGEAINYLTIHDGFTLWDKINLSINGDKEHREKFVKNALALLFTSQGKIILHGGTELARSKPLSSNDPNPGRAHTSPHINPEDEVTHFHENTYKSPDSTNMIEWARLEEFNGLKNYIKGLVKLRRSAPGLRYNKSESVQNGLIFIPEKKYPKIKDKSLKINSFNDPRLKKLTLKFINAPMTFRGYEVYLAGEVHSRESCPDTSKNPQNNRFKLIINNDGEGEITIPRIDIEQFDLQAWGDPKNLQVKIIRTKGEWDYPIESYTQYGNNEISPEAIFDDGIVVIDLSILDHRPGTSLGPYNEQIIYTVDNTLEDKMAKGFEKIKYDKLLIIHNVSNQNYSFNKSQISSSVSFDILADDSRAGTIPLTDSSVKQDQNYIHIPANSSSILGIVD